MILIGFFLNFILFVVSENSEKSLFYQTMRRNEPILPLIFLIIFAGNGKKRNKQSESDGRRRSNSTLNFTAFKAINKRHYIFHYQLIVKHVWNFHRSYRFTVILLSAELFDVLASSSKFW